MNQRLGCAILALVMLISACTPRMAPPDPVVQAQEVVPGTVTQGPTAVPEEGMQPVAETDRMDDRDTAASINGMGVDLVQRLSAAAPSPTNLFISPLSITLALGMAANGASGDTLEAILTALHLEGWDIVSANRALEDLASELDSGDLGAELALANSLWLRQGLPFRQDYLDVVGSSYDARVSSLDFGSADAAGTINAWVAEQTRDRISEIVTPPIDPQAILFLINAVYFKGAWQDPFDASLTKRAPFVRADGTEVDAEMMSRHGSYQHAATSDYQAVRLPYAGDRLSMVVVLPGSGLSIDRWIAKLDAGAWSKLTGSLHRAEGRVVLPRFTTSFETTLNEPLRAMGMGIAMSPDTAQFDRIHELALPTWISQVRHKSFVEVNEQGTEAAAVTSVEMRALAAAPTEPFSFVADRPFLYAIQDDRSGALLFLGILHDPLQAASSVFS